MRAVVVAVFTTAAVASAWLVGFAAGLPFLLVDPPPAWVAAAAGLFAALLDAVATRRPAVAPPSVRRQVPVEWSRLFAPPVVALLYGARLGVGPLTILPTWLWWAAFVVGAWHGPFASGAVGAAFAVSRAATVLGVGYWLRDQAPARMGALRGREGAVGYATLAAVLAVGIGAAAA